MTPETTFYRALELDTRAANGDGIPVVISTATPVARDGYLEILDHSREAVDLSRAPLPLIEAHDSTRVNVGLVGDLRPDGDKLRGVARFGTSARARELVEDITGGIVRSLSIGYQIIKHRTEGDTLIATRWLPYEASIVSVPADINAGFFRSLTMTENTQASRDLNSGNDGERIRAIYKMGAQFGQQELAQRAVDGNWSRERFQAAVLERMGEREVTTTPDLGLAEREARNFSFVKLLRVLASPQDSKARKEAGFELAVCGASERGEGYRIPGDVLNTGRRDLSFGSTQSGAKLVGTDHLGESFIELLRNRLVVREAGAQILDGLQGNIAIPRQSGAASWYWVSEGNPVTESTQTFDQVAASPRTGGTFTDISRRLLIQASPAVENLVRTDLAAVAARGIDTAALVGNPAVTATAMSPRGVLYTNGVGSFSHGPDGGLPDRETLVALWKAVAADNADLGSLAYITNSRVAAKLANTNLDTGSGRFVYEGDGRLFNFPFLMSNAVPSDLSKGSGSGLSAIFFGNWSDLMICLWSGLDILVDPYTNGTTGTVRIIALQDADIVVRHPESFAVAADCVTT